MKILYEDKYLIAVEKPEGLLSVPGRGSEKQDCAHSRLNTERQQESFVIHRLDQATSGILLFALNKESQKEFSRLFENRKIEKTYTAIVQGIISPHSGVIDLPLAADWPNRPKQKIDHESGKKSITEWTREKVFQDSDLSLINLRPQTGRTHQLRVHLMAIGHPIIGDRLYNPAFKEGQRLLLHAVSLVFTHPFTNEKIKLNSPTPF